MINITFDHNDLLFFYMFGPMTFKYYWLSPLIISATMCGKIITLRLSNKENNITTQ